MPKKQPKRLYSTPEVLHDAPVSNLKDADFHFDDFAATLARLIASKETATPLVIGINGAWGSGKTSLLMRTRKMLDSSKVLLDPSKPALLDFVNGDENPQALFRPCRTVWFDAWKYNGEDQVLAALLRVILAEMQKDGFWKWLNAQKEKEEFQWVNFLGDALIQFASAGTYTPKIGDYIVETPLKQASAFFDYFDEALTRLLATWVSGKPALRNDEMYEKRGVLVVFVDDLDRCLPEKTVQVLEAMKLFLDKQGCVFVLGADADIVRQAVETHYKSSGITGENAKDYLEKVIQLRFDLPPILNEAMENYLRAQGVSEAMLQRWKALVAAAEVNPRRVKSVINDLNLQWYMALNAGQAEGINRDDFICWQALMHAAPGAFVAHVAGLGEFPAVRHEFVLNAVKWQQGSDEERKAQEGFYSDYSGKDARRLRSVLKKVTFSAQFTVEALDAMIHMVAAPPKAIPVEPKQGEIVDERLKTKEATGERLEMLDEAMSEAAKSLSFERGATRSEGKRDAIPSHPGDENTLIVDEMEFKRVPKGVFIMGSKEDDADATDLEKPQHSLEIPYDYWLARFPVTNEQYSLFVKAGNAKHPVSGWEKKSDHPVVNLSWKDAQNYVKWLNETQTAGLPKGCNYCMPNEAEWEKAARGAYGNIYPWGNEFDPHKCNSAEGKKRTTMPVGTYSPSGDSPYGCADLSGNVWEWTHTLFEKYPYQAGDGREDEQKSGFRVLRGGAFSFYRQGVRCARRHGYYPDIRNVYYGFRVCVAPISK